MALKDILIHVDGADEKRPCIDFAIALAAAQQAHLICIAFAPTTLLPLYGAPDVGFTAVGDALEDVKKQAHAALAHCKDCAEKAGIGFAVHLVQGVPDEFPQNFANCARHLDVTIICQPRDSDPLVGQYALIERCLFGSGRPVLIYPAGGASSHAPKTIVAAWDGSAEAARAINDAMAFLKAAGRVYLLVGETRDTAEIESEASPLRMLDHLKRHGVPVELVRVKIDDNGVGKVLLGKAMELGADMIVMGAFHHSRWREFVLGGATLTILQDAKVPIFMAR
jgi:nucleotide-binding universal stress UspA family protein